MFKINTCIEWRCLGKYPIEKKHYSHTNIDIQNMNDNLFCDELKIKNRVKKGETN